MYLSFKEWKEKNFSNGIEWQCIISEDNDVIYDPDPSPNDVLNTTIQQSDLECVEIDGTCDLIDNATSPCSDVLDVANDNSIGSQLPQYSFTS